MVQKEDLPINQENKVEITKRDPEKKDESKNPLKSAKSLKWKTQKRKSMNIISFTKKFIILANIQNEPDKILLNTFNFIPLVKKDI